MFMLELNTKGYVKQRESQVLEFKVSFRFGDSLIEYARTLVGMANNQGGSIIFGIQDKPHEPVGLQDERFDTFDPKELNKVLLEHFASDIDWDAKIFEQFGKRFGIISVQQALSKPVICSKNHIKKHLREGAIYFRYRGETREIRHSELSQLLQTERDKEKQLWMKHIQSIAQIGPQSVQIVDTINGEMNVGGARVLIDRNLVSKLKLVKEGHFSDKEGAPTLRLIGDLEGLIDHDHVVYTEAAYPHTQSSIIEKLPIGPYDFQAIAWKLSLKGDPRYHSEIKTGKTGTVQKYSEHTITRIREEIRSDPEFVSKIRPEYSARNKKNNK